MPITVSATEDQMNFDELLQCVTQQKQVVFVERAGKPQVAIMSLDECQRIQALQQQPTWEQALQKLSAIGEQIAERRKEIAFPEVHEIIR